MAENPIVWGVHMGSHVSDRPIEGGYVGIGWHELGDARQIHASRDALKDAMIATYPDMKPGAIPVNAGSVYKFLHEMKSGHFVVYPSKSDRMVNIGKFVGDARYNEDDADGYTMQRKVEWLGRFPRNDFSQSALHEIGSAITLFRIRRYNTEFLAQIGIHKDSSADASIIDTVDAQEDVEDDDTAAVTVSRQAEETTDDFVIRRIMASMDGYQFEELVSHVMECMGYTSRVTPKSGDGGVDVIAHMDALGFQPPIVKIQCKRTTSQHSPAEVNQLLGTLGEGEFGLFVTLGSFSRAAIEIERTRSKLRLIDGDAFVEMILDNYSKLSPRYRAIVPLKQIYVPDLPSG